jgi:hypothetical protein
MARTTDVTDPAVREELEIAEKQLDEGDYNESVRRSVAVYQRILTERPDLLVEGRAGPAPLSAVAGPRQRPRFQPWPANLGVALTFDDRKQPLMKFMKDDFMMSEAITYFEHSLDAAVRVQEEPSPSS